MSIRYLKNAEIDARAWDNCITGSFNGTLHACSWYLNLICERWDALVEDQYTSVMPLIIKRHWGFEIIDVPQFSHELGIFSKEPITALKTRKFLDAIPEHFRYYRILLNKFNPLEPGNTPFFIRKKYELDLIKPYYRLIEDFNPVLRSKLNLAMACRYTFVKGISPYELIDFINNHNIQPDRRATDSHPHFLRRLAEGLIRNKSGELYGMYDENKQLASIALFTWFISRLYLQFQITAPEQAQYFPHLFLIDRFIEKYAETNSTLSFEYPAENSNPEKYTDFAARESRLIEIAHNNLPFYLRLFRLP